MNRVGRFFRLSWREQGLVLSAAGLLLAVRCGLWLLPFAKVQRLLERLTRHRAERGVKGRPPAERTAWAVKVVARILPGMNCLVVALVCQALLQRYGHSSRLHLGVCLANHSRLEAHAWVESRGKILVGDTGDLTRYTRLLPVRNHAA